MGNGFRTRLRDLLSGFWLVPGAVALGFFGLAAVVLWIDRSAGKGGFEFAFGGDSSAARDILKTVAGSLITVAGLTFSITIVTLQLVSSQFTPRVLRTFVADRLSQTVMGTFVGVVVYCLVVLRSVRDPDGGAGFVPGLGVTVAIALGLIALGLLIAFIHHTAVSIQVTNIVARVASQSLAAAERLYPEPYGEPEDGEQAAELLDAWTGEDAAVVRPIRPGFVQQIALEELVVAVGAGARIHVAARPGDFVTETTELVRIWPSSVLDEGRERRIRRLVYIADERDVEQDVAFGIRQLADIALRAISPSVNDPTTATTCIGYLEAILERLAGRAFPVAIRHWPERGVTAVVAQRGLDEHVDALVEIGRYADGDARVVMALLRALASVARSAGPGRAGSLVTVTAAVADPALDQASSEHDRKRIAAALSATKQALRSL